VERVVDGQRRAREELLAPRIAAVGGVVAVKGKVRNGEERRNKE
jgi:hypothetical protein